MVVYSRVLPLCDTGTEEENQTLILDEIDYILSSSTPVSQRGKIRE